MTKINRNSFYSTANVYLSNATLLNKEIISVSCICNASVTGNNRIICRGIWLNEWNRDIKNFWRQFAIGDSFLVRVSGICLPKTEFKPQISVGFWHYSQVNVILLQEEIFYNIIVYEGKYSPKIEIFTDRIWFTGVFLMNRRIQGFTFLVFWKLWICMKIHRNSSY